MRRGVGNALPMQFPVLHDALPKARLLGQHHMLTDEMDKSPLFTADPVFAGRSIDTRDEIFAVILVVAAV